MSKGAVPCLNFLFTQALSIELAVLAGELRLHYLRKHMLYFQGGRNKLSVTQVFASYLNILHLPFQVLFKHIEINVLSWVSHKNKFPIDKTQNCFKCLQIQVGSHLFAC